MLDIDMFIGAMESQREFLRLTQNFFVEPISWDFCEAVDDLVNIDGIEKGEALLQEADSRKLTWKDKKLETELRKGKR